MSGVLVIDRQRYRLELWTRDEGAFKRVAKRPIAVGAVGHATPRGVYLVESKSRTPDWKVPDSEWAVAAGLQPGTIFPFEDPRNPFAVGFVSLSGGEGVGIHGTKFDPQVGTRASHGCIRMRADDLERLWERIPVGLAVAIF